MMPPLIRRGYKSASTCKREAQETQRAAPQISHLRCEADPGLEISYSGLVLKQAAQRRQDSRHGNRTGAARRPH